MSKPTREKQRLEEARNQGIAWRKWGPYLSERQWGSVRENIDRGIEAWNDVTHDQSRSRAYQSGEDGIAGFCDDNMLLCFSLGLWNGKDPILKERLFGLTNSEGNHGEDVKEYYFYLDSTPTHSYAKMLYKYPQAAFPYDAAGRGEPRAARSTEFEYELLDTGVFDEDRYWDVFVEYAKADPEDILIRITAVNRGPEAAPLHLLPQLWFRNTWWADADAPRPELEAGHHDKLPGRRRHATRSSGTRYLYCEGAASCCSPTTRPTATACGASPTRPSSRRTASTTTSSAGAENAVNPAAQGDEVGLASPGHGRGPGRARRSACA